MNTHEIEDIRKQLVYAVDNDERSIIELQPEDEENCDEMPQHEWEAVTDP